MDQHDLRKYLQPGARIPPTNGAPILCTLSGTTLYTKIYMEGNSIYAASSEPEVAKKDNFWLVTIDVSRDRPKKAGDKKPGVVPERPVKGQVLEITQVGCNGARAIIVDGEK